MFLRALVLLLGLLVPVPAAAIVVQCPAGFNNCDPYSGTCYTAWTATLAGQVQAQCAADPSSCWLQAITSPPNCDDPIPPPVNPGAMRVCPPLAWCVGQPNTFDKGQPEANCHINTPNFLPTGTQALRCWSPNPSHPDRFELPALACRINIYRSFPENLSTCHYPGNLPEWVFDLTLLNYTVVVDPVPYEPPGTACAWEIRPATPIQPCVLPQSAMMAAMKNNSPNQWRGLQRYYKRLNKRIDKLTWGLAQGVFGSPMSKRYEAKVGRVVWLIDLSSLIVQLVSDPPDGNYQSFPGPGVYPPIAPLTPDATLTQAEINALHAWLVLQREAVMTARQLTDTIDKLAGALLAAEAGTPGAATWVHDLAVYADATLATLVTQGLAEIAARGAVAAGPSVSVPDGPCATPTSAANILKQAVQHGGSLYQGHLIYQEQLVTCGDAISDPAWMASDAIEDAALWNSFATVSFAAYLCGANPEYCAPPAATLTVTSPNGGGTLTTGQVVPITWTSTGVTGTVRIKLARDGKNFSELIHASAPNTGSYAWKVTGPFTTAARVWIRSNTAAAAVDASDGKSTINGLIVLWPNGGNKLTIGTTKTITWSSSGCVGPVDIKIGRNGVWARAFSEYVPNTGSKSWTVSGPASTQARVRIRCTTAPLLIDTSDAVFTIQ